QLVDNFLVLLVGARQFGNGRADVLDGDCHGLIALKRHAAGEHFVKHHAQAVEVGAGIQIPASGLFRTHVVGRTHHLTYVGHARHHTHAFSHAKIGEHSGIVGAKEDVFRLDSPMHIALFVGVIQGDGNIPRNTQGFTGGDAFHHPIVHRTAGEVIHGDVVPVFVPTNIVNRHDKIGRAHV